jgi:hypothetical protein
MLCNGVPATLRPRWERQKRDIVWVAQDQPIVGVIHGDRLGYVRQRHIEAFVLFGQRFLGVDPRGNVFIGEDPVAVAESRVADLQRAAARQTGDVGARLAAFEPSTPWVISLFGAASRIDADRLQGADKIKDADA